MEKRDKEKDYARDQRKSLLTQIFPRITYFAERSAPFISAQFKFFHADTDEAHLFLFWILAGVQERQEQLQYLGV